MVYPGGGRMVYTRVVYTRVHTRVGIPGRHVHHLRTMGGIYTTLGPWEAMYPSLYTQGGYVSPPLYTQGGYSTPYGPQGGYSTHYGPQGGYIPLLCTQGVVNLSHPGYTSQGGKPLPSRV